VPDVPPRLELPPDEAVPLEPFVRSSGLSAIVLGASKDPNAKVTILLVAPTDGIPVAAVKVPTTDAAADAVASERRTLAGLAGIEPVELRETIPRFLGAVEFQGRHGMVMTAIRGAPMTTAYFRRGHTATRARVARDFETVDEWLAALQSATAGAGARLDVADDVPARLSRRFGDDPGVADDVERFSEICASLRNEETPRTAAHGDLWFGNVLVDDGRLSGVVDWEYGAAAAAEPVRDLARFALVYAFYLDRRTGAGRRVRGHDSLVAGTPGAAVEFAMDGNGWFPELFSAFLRGGLARLGASPDRWRDVALAGVAEIAAVTDHEGFARRQLDLFRRLAARVPRQPNTAPSGRSRASPTG
jgi:aminoglycoside phosphotransferase